MNTPLYDEMKTPNWMASYRRPPKGYACVTRTPTVENDLSQVDTYKGVPIPELQAWVRRIAQCAKGLEDPRYTSGVVVGFRPHTPEEAEASKRAAAAAKARNDKRQAMQRKKDEAELKRLAKKLGKSLQ